MQASVKENNVISFRDRVNRFGEKHLKNRPGYGILVGISEYTIFTLNVIRSIKRLKREQMDAFTRVVLNQIKFTGSKALPLLSIISLSLGATTIIQAVTFLPKFGQDSFIGNLLKLVIVREVGPLITAIIILTRSGSAIAAELATQKLHREIEAVELMGINPFHFMVLPRVIGGLIATALLIVYFDFIAFIGGYMISSMVSYFPFATFIENVITSMSLADLLSTVIKMTAYGIAIPLTCSFYGFKPNTLFEIPIYVSKAVVRSLLGVFLLNGIISVIFYL